MDMEIQKQIDEIMRDIKSLQGLYNTLENKQKKNESEFSRFGELTEPLIALGGRPIPLAGIDLTPEQELYLKRYILYPVVGKINGTSAATAANYGLFFTADRACEVVSITERHRTAGSSADAALNIEKCTSGTAEDSGVALLTTPFELDATANTPRYGTLTTTKANLLLDRGDSLVMDDAGTLTDVADVCVTILLRLR